MFGPLLFLHVCTFSPPDELVSCYIMVCVTCSVVKTLGAMRESIISIVSHTFWILAFILQIACGRNSTCVISVPILMCLV